MSEEIWVVIVHPKGGLAILPIETLCELNRLAHKLNEPTYQVMAWSATMGCAVKLKREILHELRESADAVDLASGSDPCASGTSGSEDGGQGSGKVSVSGGARIKGGSSGFGADGA